MMINGNIFDVRLKIVNLSNRTPFYELVKGVGKPQPLETLDDTSSWGSSYFQLYPSDGRKARQTDIR